MPDLSFEHTLRTHPHTLIAGVDEAGRGPLAGPVTAAAVILPPNFTSPLLNDSKQLSRKTRETLYHQLTHHPHITWATATVSPAEIDTLNILRATHLAMAQALTALTPQPHIALIDGLPVKGLPIPHHPLVKGDTLSLSIAAASIIAKVTRDAIMATYHAEFPHYGFIRHMGYGTPEHLTALRKYGPCRIHRQTFQPVSQLTLPPKNWPQRHP